MTSERLFSISELASLFDISSRTIRYYEEKGMLSSEIRDSVKLQRIFTNKERRRLKMILRGKKLGFSLQEIKEMIELYESNPQGEGEKKRIFEHADRKLQEIEEQIMELQLLRNDLLAYKEKYMQSND